MSDSVLVVEDEPGIASVIEAYLSKQGYRVSATETAEAALNMIQKQAPDIIVSDIGLPGLSGIKLIEILKSEPRTVGIPVILLTVRKEEAVKLQGLKAGADDYLTKPFSPAELAARIEAVLRRARHAGAPRRIFQVEDLALDLDKGEATLRGKPLELRRKEFDLLACFLQDPGRLLTAEFLIGSLWKGDVVVTSNTLNVHIKNLRHKLGPCAELIETVVGRGFKLRAKAR